MKVGFWNINTGEGSFPKRIETFSDWCEEVEPDVLMLEEVSATLAKRMSELTGMTIIAQAFTLTKKLKPATKQIWALQRKAGAFEGKALRLQDYAHAIRLGVKITSAKDKMTIWGLHANASESGGLAAVTMAIDNLKGDPDAVMGGDFNYGLADANVLAAGSAVGGLSWESNPLKFSQWNKDYGTLMDIDENKKNDSDDEVKRIEAIKARMKALHLETKGTDYLNILPNKKGVIDYAIGGANRSVKAIRNCYNEEIWVSILKYFDHAPVMYTID